MTVASSTPMGVEIPHRRWVLGLAVFSALCSIGGATELLVSQHGNRYVPITLLQNVPFESFLIPGLLLGGVIGGASLACAFLVWRRSGAAIDVTVLAGGALTVWIIAEAALFRSVEWLHLCFGCLGLAILALGVVAAMQSGQPRHRWVVAVTAAEALGFAVPALAGVLTHARGLGQVAQAFVVVAAGLVEGLACGAGQAWAFPLPVRRWRYCLLTALGAGTVWAAVMSLLLFVHGAAAVAPPFKILAGVTVGVVGLGAIGAAQWLELRHHTPRASRWIGWTALAWTVALPMSFTPAPLVDEATPIASQIPLWACAGLLMAYVMALMTWQGVRSLRATPSSKGLLVQNTRRALDPEGQLHTASESGVKAA